MSRPLRVVSTLVVLALAFTYVLLKIDVHETARIIRSADPLWVALSVVLIFVMILPMSWRWQQLLRAREIRESLAWLMRAYFVGFTVGQVLRPRSEGTHRESTRLPSATAVRLRRSPAPCWSSALSAES